MSLNADYGLFCRAARAVVKLPGAIRLCLGGINGLRGVDYGAIIRSSAEFVPPHTAGTLRCKICARREREVAVEPNICSRRGTGEVQEVQEV